MRLARELVFGLTSLLAPPHCLACRIPQPSDAADPLCDGCWAALAPTRPPWCPGCGASLAGRGVDVIRCAACRIRRPVLAWARAACRYEGTAKICVVQLKYHRQVGLVAPMARRMAAIAHEPPAFAAEAFVPVPLHPVRAREREFNQAGLLAHALSPLVGLPVWERVVIRRRATAPQATLEADARRRNVARAFAVTQPAQVRGRTVLLVDDVVTTGSTIRACAAALTAAGAAQVGVLAFAHG